MRKCGAVWLNGQHMWTGTGQTGNELNLAGLVCNNLRKEDPDYSKCINPMRGQTGGDTWEYRRGYVDGQLDALTKSQVSLTQKKHLKMLIDSVVARF
ncbi:MAG: hypothetical protein CM15mV41_0890 [Caudoviricetes sp.]|nr:MAG: hypothetical protein CM15mV41_0890 [Caudoviricetes sp.]